MPLIKVKSHLGNSYDDASKAKQLKFAAQLIDQQTIDGVDWLRKFRQTWQYKCIEGNIPTAIFLAAKRHLGYQLPTEKAQ